MSIHGVDEDSPFKINWYIGIKCNRSFIVLPRRVSYLVGLSLPNSNSSINYGISFIHILEYIDNFILII